MLDPVIIIIIVLIVLIVMCPWFIPVYLKWRREKHEQNKPT